MNMHIFERARLARRLVNRKMGRPNKLQSPDRKVLEGLIFPHLEKEMKPARVLFIGCDWYTEHYYKFFSGESVTIDCDESKKVYGGKNHIVDGIENIDKYIVNNSIDLIVCYGVFGWGLNDIKIIESAFEKCFNILKPGGIFILGWNDLPIYRPCHPDELESLKLFEKYHFAPLGGSGYAENTSKQVRVNFFNKFIS